MTNSIRDNLSILAALQQTDADAAAIEKKFAGVGARLAALDDQLAAFAKQFTEQELKRDTLKKQYRSDEEEVRAIEGRIIKAEEKLRSVKTNKEYHSMLKEIDEFKSKKAALEDTMIEMLETIEIAEKDAASLKADLADLQAEIEERRNEIQVEADAQHLELERLNQRRQSVWDRLDPKLQKMYDRAKHQGKGTAVAPVDDAVCLACRMNIPPQGFIELLRMNAIQMCPHCQRIIYPKAMIDDL
jgi:uncharacterized protein